MSDALEKESPEFVLAGEAEIGKVYLSRGGKEVTLISKDNAKGLIKVKIHASGNTIPIPIDYPLLPLEAVEKVVSQKVEESVVEASVAEKEITVEDIKEETSTEEVLPVEMSALATEESKEEVPQEVAKEDPMKNYGPKKSVKESIRDLFDDGKEMTVEELSEATGGAVTTVRLKLSELNREGYALARKNKKYSKLEV